ncbi:hypothetical protein [Flammeovirga sp. OC4]|uniref:hypothetical protein n=1 Tax=Flammeovirga sp. OC4 TaxID=1382345 RepID=UPI0005C71C81|nr:hypothetical protein [Flammeovirga sp. OC4]
MNSLMDKLGMGSFLMSIPASISTWISESYWREMLSDSNIFWITASKSMTILSIIWLILKIYNEAMLRLESTKKEDEETR